MKLRNKKTGEIVEFRYLQPDHVAPLVLTTYENDKPKMYTYASLAELNAEWGDVAEEPKDYWWISPVDTDVVQCVEDAKDEVDKYNKEIGNYFSSREEAEKAVEKLKAWKRLKDKGFRFMHNKVIGEYGNVSYRLNYPICAVEEKDLDLLFGGEE